MTYRATPVTQRDGSPLANSNCRMASAATGLDYDTLGAKTSTGSKMRNYSGDPSGGTTATDAVRAWDHYDEVLDVRNGKPWSEVEASLAAGRLVHLDVWAARAGGPCCNSAVGHTIVVAPEHRTKDGRSEYLVADPWCYPPKWVWWPESKLRAGAEEWADRCGWRSATKGGPRDIRKLTPVRLARIVKELMSEWTPLEPLLPEDDDYEPGETTGAMPCLWTRTDAHAEAAGGDDMAINVTPETVTSSSVAVIKKGLAFYRDPKLTDKLGTFSSARKVPYFGLPLGVDSVSRAVLVNTSTPYTDGQQRPTIVYVKKADVPTEAAPVTPPPSNAERDKQWRSWLSSDSDAPDKSGSTGGEDMVEETVDPTIEDDDGDESDTTEAPAPEEGGEA